MLNRSNSFSHCRRSLMERDSCLAWGEKPRPRSIERLCRMKMVKALPLTSVTKPNTPHKQSKPLSTSCSALNKSEATRIYDVNKFKRRIRLNIVLDCVAYDSLKAGQRKAKCYPMEFKSSTRMMRPRLTIQYRRRVK
eukprot:TRINITY_DN2541_c0_g1_i3.p1 TRINITY_DN2541_c0_g1~~TRINITY_DN2541_c0_g1_i3.p1  ORF type:complete len:137 (-),score=37.20 TRINITY_DN2541_c0_g1_i3:126-536(-)